MTEKPKKNVTQFNGYDKRKEVTLKYIGMQVLTKHVITSSRPQQIQDRYISFHIYAEYLQEKHQNINKKPTKNIERKCNSDE